jgi:hypothetical protein
VKQGRASRDVSESHKVEPKPKKVSEMAAAGLGEMRGSHATDGGDLPFKTEPLYLGRGYKAPGPSPDRAGPGGGRTIYRSGSQGRR